MAGEGGGSDGRELEELVFCRFEGLKLAQGSLQSLELDQERLVLRSCSAILQGDSN